jgi:hypothetical protein
MATRKLNELLNNTGKNTSNIDAISDKIAQNVIKILVSGDKIEALNGKGRKNLSGGRKLGNIDTAKYTTISENQNTRMRKGDGVANVLARLYALMKGSHDEDVKQMELTRNFKEEQHKEQKGYSKIKHQQFGKKRSKFKTKSSLTGLVVLGLITNMDSIVNWMEKFTEPGGGLDTMLGKLSEVWNSVKHEMLKVLYAKQEEYLTELKAQFEKHTGFNFDELSGNIKKTIQTDIDFVKRIIDDFNTGVYATIDNVKQLISDITKTAKEIGSGLLESMHKKLEGMQKIFYETASFFKNMQPLDFFKMDKWQELLMITPNAIKGMFTDKSWGAVGWDAVNKLTDMYDLKNIPDASNNAKSLVAGGLKSIDNNVMPMARRLGDSFGSGVTKTGENVADWSEVMASKIREAIPEGFRMFNETAQRNWAEKFSELHAGGSSSQVGDILKKLGLTTYDLFKKSVDVGTSAMPLVSYIGDTKNPMSIPEDVKRVNVNPVTYENIPGKTNVVGKPDKSPSGVGNAAGIRPNHPTVGRIQQQNAVHP